MGACRMSEPSTQSELKLPQSDYLDRELRFLHCAGCDEVRRLYTRMSMNPFAIVAMIEVFSREHKDCLKFKNTARARAALYFRRQVQRFAASAEFAK